MKFNNNQNGKQNELEMDDMNIKSHLNTSLDLSGISVSEDLINRTLEAIKKQSAEQIVSQTSTKDINKKVISWNKYVRGFAGVAAAVFIVAVGYNAMSQFNLGSSKSEDSNTAELDDSSLDQIMMEEAAEDSSSFTTSEKADANFSTDTTSADTAAQEPMEEIVIESAPQYTITADIFVAEDEAKAYGYDIDGATDGEGEAGSTEPAASMPKVSTSLRKSELAELLTFRDIFLPTPEQAEYIMITDEINGSSITMTSQEQILEFYSVMDQHQFTYGTEDTSDQNYTVEVKSPEEAFYTLIVGKNITVRHVEGDSVSQSIYFAVDDMLLKQKLDEFYKKYNK